MRVRILIHSCNIGLKGRCELLGNLQIVVDELLWNSDDLEWWELLRVEGVGHGVALPRALDHEGLRKVFGLDAHEMPGASLNNFNFIYNLTI